MELLKYSSNEFVPFQVCINNDLNNMLNMKSIKFGFVLLLMIPFLVFKGFSQEKVVIDKIVAVVGNSAILKSDLFNQQRQLESQGITFGANAQCELLDEMLYQKLLYNQAIIDSVEVSEKNKSWIAGCVSLSSRLGHVSSWKLTMVNPLKN